MFGYPIRSGNRSSSLIANLLPSLFLITFTVLTRNINGGTLFTLTAFLVSTNIPTLSISKSLQKSLNMVEDELLVINFILGNCLFNIVYIFLNTLLPQVARTTLMGALCAISVLTGLWKGLSDEDYQNEDSLVKRGLRYFVALLALIPGIYSIYKSLPANYWRGEDPWGLVVCAREIAVKNFTPLEAYEYFLAYFQLFTSGFYYHVAGIITVTGAHEEFLVRYGGIIMGGTLTALTYVTVKRLTNATGGLLAAFFLFLNPYMVLRFSSPLREYYGYLILIVFILLSNLRARSNQRFSPIYVLTSAVLFGTALVNHSLTPIFILGILGFDVMNNIIKKRFNPIYETCAMFGVSLLLAIPYIQILYIPFLKFFSINLIGLTLYGALGFIIFSAIILLLKNRVNEKSFQVSNPVKLVFLFLLATVFVVNLYYPPILGPDFTFQYLKKSQFSFSLGWVALIGFLALAYSNTPLQVYALALQVASFVDLSYLGIKVPLDRIGVYGMWIMSYSAAQLIVKVISFTGFEPINIEGMQFRASWFKEYAWRNRYAILILILIMTPFIREVGQIRQSPVTYTSDRMNKAAEFVEILEKGDLVIPHRLLIPVIYYVDTPQENKLVIDKRGDWMDQFYASETVYDMSRWIQETQPDAKRIHFFTQKSFHSSDRFGSLSEEIIEDYGKEREWGDSRSITFDIPFTLESLPLENVRYIGNNGSRIVSSIGEGDKIREISNVMYDPTSPCKAFRMYFTVENHSGLHSIGYAWSSDGLNWENSNLNLTGLSDPYIVKQDTTYVMFAINDQGSLVRLGSQEGENWEKESVIVEPPKGYEYWKVESPIAWTESSTWNLVYTLTTVNETNNGSKIIQRNSTDGITWSGEKQVEPVLLSKSYEHQVQDKILLTDRVELDQGVMFFGRVHAEKRGGDMEWKTGSMRFPDGIEKKAAYLRSFTYTDYPEYSRDVKSIQFTRDLKGNPLFLYTGDGVVDGVHLGYVDDNIGWDKEWAVEP